VGLEVKLYSFVTTTLAACELSHLSWIHNSAFPYDATGWDIHVRCCSVIRSVLFPALWIHNAVSFPMKIQGIFLYKGPSIERVHRRRYRNRVTWVKTCRITLIKIGKSVPLQAWSSSEGSGKLRFLDYVTTAQDGGKVVCLTHRQLLPPTNAAGTHFC